jgi:ABC-type glycerol-3-phosphate transport system substrate-binding protein
MKKFMSFALALAMACGFAACSNDTTNAEAEKAADETIEAEKDTDAQMEEQDKIEDENGGEVADYGADTSTGEESTD